MLQLPFGIGGTGSGYSFDGLRAASFHFLRASYFSQIFLRTNSERLRFVILQHSSSFAKVSLSILTRNIKVLGLSVGRPIFLTGTRKVHLTFVAPEFIIGCVAPKVKRFTKWFFTSLPSISAMLERICSIWYHIYAAIRLLAVVGTGSGCIFDGLRAASFHFLRSLYTWWIPFRMTSDREVSSAFALSSSSFRMILSTRTRIIVSFGFSGCGPGFFGATNASPPLRSYELIILL